MTDAITIEDIDEKVKNKIYTQKYGKKSEIEGVKIVSLPYHVGDDGDFIELMRITEKDELADFPGFKIAQISRSRMFKNTIKAWHLHFKQNEIWFIPPECRVLVGLWDIRDRSKTKNSVMRLISGGGKAQLIFIPKGVAHGSANLMDDSATIIYFVDHSFNITNPDEKRIKWDSLGEDFWKPQRD